MSTFILLVTLLSAPPPQDPDPVPELRFEVRFPAAASETKLDGRLLVLIAARSPVATRSDVEPRFAVSDGVDTAQVFGVDIEDLESTGVAIVDASSFGYPLRSTAALLPGEYTVQAVLHRYETFHRKDGHVVKLPMDRGEGQRWNAAPGNLLCAPQSLTIAAGTPVTVQLELDRVIPAIEAPQDTRYIKHVRIVSERLSRFWGRRMELGAVVLLPAGFDDHPDARFPLVVNHGHYPHTFGGFRETPPDAELAPDYSSRFRMAGYNRVQQEQAYELFKTWTSPDFPRFVVIQVQHANPFYDDSYAVNSANLGPYGDAIQYELIPFVEKRFHCIGTGWARFTYGGSTGGWEALAVSVFYPDEYNGCFASCPDPIDFRAYCLVNLYEHENAYYDAGPFQRVLRPGHRNWLGEVSSTLLSMNHRELALGTRSRSGQQWDIWEAVFSPCGDDGYPRRIWDKETGVIDREVAAYWREHYDLRHIMARDWATLGPKLAGKIRIYCGDMDNYYLNNAVYLAEEFLESTTEPYYAGEVDYGDRAEHCWNGDHTRPNAVSRLRYHQMYVAMMLARMQATAPAGADLTSWRY